MPVKLGAKPEHGFDQPLGLMSDCHRRIEYFLGLLEKVLNDAGGKALTDPQRGAVEAALKYFDSAGPRHTQDEEESLFPRLRELDQLAVREALQQVDALEQEHRIADAAHAEVRVWFRRWLDFGSLAESQIASLAQTLEQLRELYRRHIHLEDASLFPLARGVLSREQLQQMGREMAARRGLSVQRQD
jgi:hemerythrin-like domain-containing protein